MPSGASFTKIPLWILQYLIDNYFKNYLNKQYQGITLDNIDQVQWSNMSQGTNELKQRSNPSIDGKKSQ